MSQTYIVILFFFLKEGSLFLIFPLSVLKTFLHDPLVEWSKQAKGLSKAQANETGEIVNEKVCEFLGFRPLMYLYILLEQHA